MYQSPSFFLRRIGENFQNQLQCKSFALSFIIYTNTSIKSGSVYSLRSNSSLILDRPKGRILSTLGARSFYAAAPTLWNSLPANIRDITSLNIFKEKVKTYLFNLAYNK